MEKEMCSQPPESMRKRVMMSLLVGITPVCSPALEHLWVCTGPCIDHQNIDLKQRDCQIFLQQAYIYSGSAGNCKYQQAMCRTMKGNLFSREEKEAGRAGLNKENMAFYWLSPCQEKKGLFFLLGLCYCCRVWECLLWCPGWVLIEVSVYQFFLHWYTFGRHDICILRLKM